MLSWSYQPPLNCLIVKSPLFSTLDLPYTLFQIMFASFRTKSFRVLSSYGLPHPLGKIFKTLIWRDCGKDSVLLFSVILCFTFRVLGVGSSSALLGFSFLHVMSSLQTSWGEDDYSSSILSWPCLLSIGGAWFRKGITDFSATVTQNLASATGSCEQRDMPVACSDWKCTVTLDWEL